MSNSTFKSVKNLAGSLSDLNVSGDAQVHGGLSVATFANEAAATAALGKVGVGTIVYFTDYGKLAVWSVNVWKTITMDVP
jgi:hypothetical protein